MRPLPPEIFTNFKKALEGLLHCFGKWLMTPLYPTMLLSQKGPGTRIPTTMCI